MSFIFVRHLKKLIHSYIKKIKLKEKPMYKLFIDSITLKIDYQLSNKLYDYERLIFYLKANGYKEENIVNKKLINKFKGMYLVRDIAQNNLLTVFSFTDNATHSTQLIYVYALKHGMYIEFNGLVQYGKDYRKEKFTLLHLLWSKFDCSISKIDVAIDIEAKFENISVYDKNSNILPIYEQKSNTNIHYYKIKNRLQRKLKSYSKNNQKYREFPLAYDLTRVELTLKGTLLKDLTSYELLSKRVAKELANYLIKVSDIDMLISTSDINDMFKSLFSILKNGRNTKRYSNYFKNIDTKVRSMALAWQSLNSSLTFKDFALEYNIGITVLKRYRRFYRAKILS